MARFVFTLQQVLNARQREEDALRRAVAAIERERRSLEDRIRSQQELIRGSRHALSSRLVGMLAVADVRGEGATTLRAMRSAQKLVIELAGVHRRLERSRGELLAASKRRRAVELLRDKRFSQWKHALDKAETAALDELAVQRIRRKDETI